MPEIAKLEPIHASTAAPVRRSARVAVDMQVQVFTTKVTCCGRGHELGMNGMAVHVPMELVVGDTIRIMFQPPGSKVRFGLFGVIRNRDGFRYGVEFLELRKGEKDELDRVLRALIPVVAAS